MKRGIRRLLLIFFSLMLVYALWQLWRIFDEYRAGKESYSGLEQYVSFATAEDAGESGGLPVPSGMESGEEPATQEETASVPAGENTEPVDFSSWPQVDFAGLYQINPDVVGWIYVEGTDINYPIVQGPDNTYYLNRLFNGSHNSAGCIFLDAGCAFDFSGRHSIIYGHHMKDQSMFYGLMNYKKQAFYDEHPVGLLVTPDAYYKIQFFSGYVSDTWANAWELHFTDSEYSSWLDEIQDRSCFASAYTPEYSDRVVTLSTCSYEFDTAKFVLHGFISDAYDREAGLYLPEE